MLIMDQKQQQQLLKYFNNRKVSEHYPIRMSFLDYVDIDPHIHLLILSKLHKEQSQQLIKQKIHHLLQTRRFNQLLKQAEKLKGLSFPDLAKKVQQAKAATLQQKNKLGDQDIEARLIELDTLSNKQDADFKAIDEGQLNVYKLAKIYYDQGNFQKAHDIMKKLQKQLLNNSLYIKTTWALFYCEILLENQKVIKKTIERLKYKIDEYEQRQKSERKELSYDKQAESVKSSYARRKQFLNLITIAYFLEHKYETFEKFVNFCSEQQNSAVIQLTCPYLVRYISVALILNKTLHKNRKFDLFTLIESLRRKIYKYSDPFIDFLTELNIQFDFQSAKQKIKSIRECIHKDALLKPLQNRIIQNCYFLFYKVYCKVNERVSFAEIAALTGKTEEQAQLWILGFIRSLDIEAKIDSVDRAVFSYREEESLNEKFIDLIPKMSSFINTLSQSSK